MDKCSVTYLDYNATAPVRPQVREAIAHMLQTVGNPSSVHSAGRHAYHQLTEARKSVADLVGGMAEQVIFTSGGTEANFLGILGTAVRQHPADRKISHILVGASEHTSVLAAVEETGLPFDLIPVDEHGLIKMAAFEELLEKTAAPCLVCVMLANNETGVVQPIENIARLAERYDALMHVDAVQGAGKLDLSCLGMGVCSPNQTLAGITSVALSAHKIGGPQGVGALIIRDGHHIKAQLTGGGQEQGRRCGTENMPGIVGFGVAAQYAGQEREQLSGELRTLRDQLETQVKAVCPESVFFSQDAERLANTSCFAIPGLDAEKAIINFDLEGVCLSSGSACSSGKVARSHVLRAMNVGDDMSSCALRVSLGRETTKQDVEHCLHALEKILNRFKTSKQHNELTSNQLAGE